MDEPDDPRARLRNRVLLDLATSGWTLAPAVAGATLLVAAAAVAAPATAAVTAFAGLATVLAAGGAAVTRWVYGGERIVERAMRREADAEHARREAALDDLDLRLTADGDDRTQHALRRLRNLHGRLWDRDAEVPPPAEVVQQAQELFRFAVQALERTLSFQSTAGTLATRDARLAVSQSRERLVAEVEQSVEQLARTLDQLQLLSLEEESGRRLAAIRDELSASLDVARRVDERLRGGGMTNDQTRMTRE